MKKTLIALACTMAIAMGANAQVTKTLSVVPGGLDKALTYDEKQKTTELILSGQVDARDFEIMRDRMPALEYIDLKDASIVEYKGNKGTQYTDKGRPMDASYAANTIPQNAFFKNGNGSGKRSLRKVVYPADLEGVGAQAFYACYALEEVSFPAGVKKLDDEAYYNCKALNSISVEGDAPVAKMGKGVFYAVNPATCILHVKKGTSEQFNAAKQWKDFKKNITEDIE